MFYYNSQSVISGSSIFGSHNKAVLSKCI